MDGEHTAPQEVQETGHTYLRRIRTSDATSMALLHENWRAARERPPAKNVVR